MSKYELKLVSKAHPSMQEVLRNLVKMYCYEWSQYTGMEVDEYGEYLFERYLSRYWENDECKAFLLCCIEDYSKEQWCGFVLIDKDFCIHQDFDYAIGEFFVMYKYRRHGAGSWMANAVFDRFHGRWEVGRNPKNLTAYSFWEKVISRYTHDEYELACAVPEHRYADGTLGDIFSFDNSIAEKR